MHKSSICYNHPVRAQGPHEVEYQQLTRSNGSRQSAAFLKQPSSQSYIAFRKLAQASTEAVPPTAEDASEFACTARCSASLRFCLSSSS